MSYPKSGRATPVRIFTIMFLSASLAGATTISVCNTGVTGAVGTCGSTLLSSGATDPHWALQKQSIPSSTSLATILTGLVGTYTFTAPANANTPNIVWLQNAVSSASEWITPQLENNSGGYYIYHTTFTGGVSLLGLAGRYSSDNELFGVALNNTLVAGFPLNCPACFNIWTDFNVPGLTVNNGNNTLDFIVRNRGVGGIDSSFTDTGFRAEFVVPEPSTVTLSLAGLGFLLVLRNRFRSLSTK